MSNRYKCFPCLCDVCNRLHCPWHVKYQYEVCLHNIRSDCCPKVKCDFFQSKYKRPVLRVIRKGKRSDLILSKLDYIIKILEGKK